MNPLFCLLAFVIGCSLVDDFEGNGINSQSTSVKAETVVAPAAPRTQELPKNLSSNIYAAISTRLGAPMPEAAFSGRFIISNRCLTFKEEVSSTIYTAILPAGSVFASDGSTVTTFQVDNKPVDIGQLYQVSGGEVNVEGVPFYKLGGSIDSGCPNKYVGIGEILR